MMTPTERYALPAVLDMGNGSIRVMLADALADGSLVVVGAGEEPSAGVEEGKIVDLEQATKALTRAVRAAELESGRKVKRVFVAASGEHIRSHASEGKVVIGGGGLREAAGAEEEKPFEVKGGVVGAREVAKVREMGVAAVSDSDVLVLDVIDKRYRIDQQRNIRNPVGMSGRLLAGDLHLIVAERQALENMESCVQRAGMTLVGSVVFSGLAAARAVLNEEERRLGVCVLDIGAHTTEMAIFYNGGVYETDVYLEAANLIHTDISAVHHTTLASAEKCKRQIGVTVPSGKGEPLPLVSTSGEQIEVSHSLLLNTVTSRVEMLLENVDQALRAFEQKEARKLTAGIVLTGGGALLPGLATMVTNRLNIPVRIGAPAYNGAKSERVKTPAFAVSIGLLMMARDAGIARETLPLMKRLKDFFFHSSHAKEKKHGHQ